MNNRMAFAKALPPKVNAVVMTFLYALFLVTLFHKIMEHNAKNAASPFEHIYPEFMVLQCSYKASSRATKIRPKAVGGVILDSFLELP